MILNPLIYLLFQSFSSLAMKDVFEILSYWWGNEYWERRGIERLIWIFVLKLMWMPSLIWKTVVKREP